MTKYGTLAANPVVDDEHYEIIVCPECGSDNISALHHKWNYAIPETNYNHCNDCGHSWGYE